MADDAPQWHDTLRDFAEKHSDTVGEPMGIISNTDTTVVQMGTRGLVLGGKDDGTRMFMTYDPLLHPDDDSDVVGEREQPTVDNSAAEDMDARAEANSGNNVPENVMLA